MFGWAGIGWMENNEEKIGQKMSLCVVWLKRGEKTIFRWGLGIFHQNSYKTCISEMKRRGVKMPTERERQK